MADLEELSREELIALLRAAYAQVHTLHEQVEALHEQVQALHEQVEALRSQSGSGGAKTIPPPFVKANRPPKNDQPRKKRTSSFVRRKQTPTHVQIHACDTCPDCGRSLSGGWEHRRRQVIEIPLSPVQITDHVILARHCGVCNRRCLPAVDLSEQVVAKSRVGIRLMSLVAYLRTVARLPLASVQRLLGLLYGLHLSVGELSRLLHAVAQRAQPLMRQLLGQVRSAPFVHADETGWREDGQNGYLWTFSTPQVRYLLYHRSRASAVPEQVLGRDFAGVVVSDFYSGYSPLPCRRQRCWVHLLRDLHARCEQHPPWRGWVDAVRAVYERAKGWSAPAYLRGLALERARCRAREAFEAELQSLASSYVGSELPHSGLAARMVRFVKELFVFVELPGVPSENNAAERSLRPSVISRKISGGTRSAAGSSTRATLMSLFGTWQLQGKEPWTACQQMLAQPTA